MKTNKAGIELLHSFEKLRLEPYDDATGLKILDWRKVKGYATIGWGHKIGPKDTNLRGPITKDTADRVFANDLSGAEREVNTKVKVALTGNQYSALVAFVFNVGGTAFNEANCTLLKLLNQGHYEAVPAQIMRWDKTTINGVKVLSSGLTKRRWAERKLWLTPSDVEPTVPGDSETNVVTKATIKAPVTVKT